MNRTCLESRSVLSAVLCGASVLVAVGCGSDESGVRMWCEGVCAAAARCGSVASDCATSCVEHEPTLAHLSASGASALKPCLEQLSCQALGGDQSAWKSEQQACWNHARMSVAVSDDARHLCSSYALAWFDCGYSLAVDDCGRIYSMWDDSVVDRIALCGAKETCEELQTCEQSVFDNL
jgi:hypothetical protein